MRTLTGAVYLSALLTAACAPRVSPVAPTLPTLPSRAGELVSATPSPRPEAPGDPVADLIAASARHFEQGQQQLQQGHLDAARTEFNRALEVVLESPTGARSDPRLREHFDRLVERISAYEVTALAQADGFAERRLDPATIDDLLAVSTFEIPAATAQTKETVAADLESTIHDLEIPLNAKVLQFGH